MRTGDQIDLGPSIIARIEPGESGEPQWRLTLRRRYQNLVIDIYPDEVDAIVAFLVRNGWQPPNPRPHAEEQAPAPAAQTPPQSGPTADIRTWRSIGPVDVDQAVSARAMDARTKRG